MDVNSNSHAEQSRNDTHVKDIRPGTLMHHKEKKVTSGNCRHATRSWHNLLSFKTNLISCVLFSLTPTHHCPAVSFLLSPYGSETLICNSELNYIVCLISNCTVVAWRFMILWNQKRIHQFLSEMLAVLRTSFPCCSGDGWWSISPKLEGS